MMGTDYRTYKIYRRCAQVERNIDTGCLKVNRVEYGFVSRSNFNALNELNTLFQQHTQLTSTLTVNPSPDGDPRESNSSFNIFLNDKVIVSSDSWSHHQELFGSDLPHIVRYIKTQLNLDPEASVFKGAAEWFKPTDVPINTDKDAVDAFFVVYQEQLTEDKSRFFARKTLVQDTWKLEDILRHALFDKKFGCFDNRSMKVCKQLGWISNKGGITTTAPSVVQEIFESIKSAQPLSKDNSIF